MVSGPVTFIEYLFGDSSFNSTKEATHAPLHKVLLVAAMVQLFVHLLLAIFVLFIIVDSGWI